jgi:SAM-dependent methyltransferase
MNDYELVAGEYYDQSRHPTCVEFRVGSAQLIAAALPANPGRALEVGAGDSLLAPLLYGRDLSRLVVSDLNPGMLAYSRKWQSAGVHLLVADASHLPLPDHAIDLLVASLGDPFNTEEFWREAGRLLSQSGAILFTTPSYYWASTVRKLDRTARFGLANQNVIFVPSIVLDESAQQDLVAQAGLQVKSVTHFLRGELPAVVSKALLSLRDEDAVVTCYEVTRAN